MRFPKPSPEFTSTVWRDWVAQFNNVVYHTCLDWRKTLDRDDKLVYRPNLSPSKWSLESRRLQSDSTPKTGMGDPDQGGRRASPNPRVMIGDGGRIPG